MCDLSWKCTVGIYLWLENIGAAEKKKKKGQTQILVQFQKIWMHEYKHKSRFKGDQI